MPNHATRKMLAASAAMLGFGVMSAGTAAETFTLPPLPYSYSKNEPVIDSKTMQLHHDKHHAAYVKALNQAVEAAGGAWTSKPLQDILGNLSSVPDSVRATVRNNAGGHANHSMYWEIMGGRGGAPSGDVAAAIDRDFGSFSALQEAFNAAGAKIFGSGWVFVTVDRAGKLALTSRPNQDTPLMDGERVLIGNDVWEHAYYLKYENRRADYLKAWWNVLDWDKIAERYAAAKAGTLAY